MLVHLVLDLAVNISSRGLYIERVTVATAFGSHNHLAGLILEALELSRVVLEPQVPKLLFLLALGVGVEDLKQITTLIDLTVSIGVDDLGQVFHEAEVGSHGICESSNLAEFRNQGDLSTCPSVLMDQERLVWLSDVLIVPGLVVLLV